jgi:hypothetical protein
MNKLAVRSPVWMLAAWSLLAPAFVSPTLAHSHFAGDRPHGHTRPDCISVDPRQPSESGDNRIGHGRLSLSEADLHWHRYLLWLGAVEYLPGSTEPGSPEPKSPSPCDWETTIAVSAAQGIRASSTGLAVDHVQLASRFAECVYPSGRHEISAVGVAPSVPLCDRARHERSGVQLA